MVHLLAFHIAASESRAASSCTDTDIYGSLLNTDEFDSSVQALPPAAFFNPPVQPPLRAQVFLDNLPAVAQQGTAASPGSPGSCEAQSFGYGLGSYTAARYANGSRKWNLALPQNSVSAAYLYACLMTFCAAEAKRNRWERVGSLSSAARDGSGSRWPPSGGDAGPG